ncbi:hypothetical protein Q0M94_19290 (plasmid) [Deinococcus radiomollis]|uniref:hypothetical protein n=1 Tax=Deinococcus radiomollis TaxID=468916 RepID=UPI003891B2E9
MTVPEINWLQEAVRIAGTGGIAYGAFLLANRGRKLDVLIKESFASMKVLTQSVIFSIEELILLKSEISFVGRGKSNVQMMRHLVTDGHYKTRLDNLEKMVNEFRVNRKDLVLLSEEARWNYNRIIFKMRDLHNDIVLLGILLEAFVDVFQGGRNLFEMIELKNKASLIIEELIEIEEEFINEAYASLKLPKYKRLYPGKPKLSWSQKALLDLQHIGRL